MPDVIRTLKPANPKTNNLPVTVVGIAPSIALGVAAGVLFRCTIPAMAVTLALFIGLQIAMPLWIRPHRAGRAPTRVT